MSFHALGFACFVSLMLMFLLWALGFVEQRTISRPFDMCVAGYLISLLAAKIHKYWIDRGDDERRD